ncbi:DUF1707 domain-containing protein [Geodermatophilus sp. CPCC 206100]|uniref:DUF1707 domain-containing protein n=1 Tax=Geodermatophilus sp. CPCC 206100 TaxID=3020054 RepID=UPI003B0008AF
MSSDADPARPSAVRASDADREAVVSRLQKALAEGRIDLSEFGDRAEGAYAAVTRDDLDGLVADLPADAPPPVEIVGTRVPESMTSVFGDVKVEGTADVPRQVSTTFGDVRLDLRNLRTDADRVELVLGAVFGDIDVIVAEGVDAELQGWTVFGDKKTQLAPVPRVAGTPRVVVRARTVFGDLRLRSLAPGESPSRWRAIMDRLAQRHVPPPVPPPPPAPPLPPPPPKTLG